MDFCESQVDHTIFYKNTGNEKVMVLIVYVDDIILIDNYEIRLTFVKKKLVVDFQIKNLGTLKCFLCMEFAESKLAFLSTNGNS